MRSRVFLAGAVQAAVMGAALAEAPTQASAIDLQVVVANKTVVLHTPAGGLPISYSDNGTMVGRAKDLEFYTGSAFDRGTWWVVANKICHRWRSWLGGKDHCVTVNKMEGDKVHWKSSDGYSGTATINAKK
jgi:hypothetical protein